MELELKYKMAKQVELKLEKAKLRSKEEIITSLNPVVKEWFFSKFSSFSLPQLYGVMPIWERRNILISAPTGGTKTLTAFLSILNYLVNLAEKQELEDKVYAVYVSPLKALSNDIHKNLIEPLAEIKEIAKKRIVKLQEIRVSLRTGDTTIKERARQTKNLPHILITTPETLAIVLNAPKFSLGLKAVEFVIVDEIHALANKRGVHLSLSLERLENESIIKPVRIGLSATIAPLNEIAKFLIGVEENRNCLIADVEFEKKIDVSILIPSDLDSSSGAEMHSSLYKLMDKLIQEHKTTLIFTNTRSATERVIHHLKEMFPSRYLDNPGDEPIPSPSGTLVARGIGAHHSSLSKEHRFNIEERLRNGKLKVVVSSTSLELGIDIGYIDLVILLGSPKSTARAMQRLGRSGHKLHDVVKGRFIVLDRDDLVECAIMQKEMIERKIDKVQIPRNCLDVLSQQIYGMAISKIWQIKEMFSVIKKSYCFCNLSYEDFLSVISYLAGEYALEDKHVYGKIWYDSETGQIGKKGKLARVIYMTNVGTIPDESFVSVVIARGEGKEGSKVGVIDEGFFERLKQGDVFVLGGHKYEFLYNRGMKAYVNASVYRPPTIPSWFSEMLPLSFDLALEISRFRGLVEEKMKANKSRREIEGFIKDFCYLSEETSSKIYDYLNLQYKYIGIPGNKKILIENYRGEKEYWVFHALFGRRVNDALSRAIAFCLARLGGRDVEIGISDNGFFLVGERVDKEKIIKAVKFLNPGNLEEVLKEAIERTELMKRRFRHTAVRSLMILRKYKGREKSAGKQQLSSHFLLSAVQKLTKEFPILKEAKREIMEEVMDIDNAKRVLDWLKNEKIRVEFKETSIPSPFSLNLIMQGHYDLVKMEDKIEFLKRIYREIRDKVR